MCKQLLVIVMLVFCAAYIEAQPIYNSEGIQLEYVMNEAEKELYKSVNIITAPTPAPSGEIRPIAEYEPMEAVMVRYPFGIPIYLIKEMSEVVDVITIVGSVYEQNSVINQYLSNNIDTSRCDFLIRPTDSYWTRDYGPWFIAIDNSSVAMFDFTYNRPRYNDNMINTYLAPFLQMDRYASSIELTGGNYMNDGTSQAASTTLTYTENPAWTHQEIHDHFEEYLGVSDFHFINDPLGDYIEHIDCWGKYLAPDKVLIGQVAETDWRYQDYEDVAEYFAGLTSPYGTPMQVFRVYTPGNYQTTPYTNSLILNNKVFVPLSGSTHDAAAIEVYQNAMPGYEIVGINYNYWQNTDALHCRTHEIADREMLYVKHQPLHGEVESYGSVTFTTELYSYGNHNIYADSVFVYVKSDNGEFVPYNMTNVEDNTWEVAIEGLPMGEVEYYIYAADDSGRNECHPYIGAPDPHSFDLVYLSTIPGDVNGNNVVDVNDITLTINYLFGQIPDPFIFNNADVNGDSVINVLDIFKIVNIIYNSK